MTETTLRRALDGVHAVEFADVLPVFVAWHGGTTFNVYRIRDGGARTAVSEIDVFSVCDDEGYPLEPDAARERMREHLGEMATRLAR